MEWKRRYVDTHEGLSALETLQNNGSLINVSPGDKNAKNVTKLKKPIEREEMIKRQQNVDKFMYDTLALRAEDILEVDYAKLLAMSIQARPKIVEGKMEHTYTFADMVKNASTFEKEMNRAEEEYRNTVDAEYTAEQ